MIENFNKIINNKSFEKVGPLTVIQRKNFLNEVVRSHDLMGLTFAYLTFLDCNFIDIDFRHTIFISCDFTNCNFTETIFFKSELDNCNFKNCKIFQSDLVRANFMESNFTDCHFDIVIGSNVNSLGRSEWRSPLFGMREKTIVSAAPSSPESNIAPTPNLFSADSVTGEIQNINIAFNQFKQRMTQIGNQYTGEKQEYFFEQLNQ